MLNKSRKWWDTDTSFKEVLQHSFTNFQSGFLSSAVITSVKVDSILMIVIFYYFLKENEINIFSRPKYTSKLGKKVIYPVPNTIGFTSGYLLCKYLVNLF